MAAPEFEVGMDAAAFLESAIQLPLLAVPLLSRGSAPGSPMVPAVTLALGERTLLLSRVSTPAEAASSVSDWVSHWELAAVAPVVLAP